MWGQEWEDTATFTLALQAEGGSGLRVSSGPLVSKTGQLWCLPVQVCELGLEALRPNVQPLYRIPGPLDIQLLHGPLPRPVEQRDAQALACQTCGHSQVCLATILPVRSPSVPLPVSRLPTHLSTQGLLHAYY